MSWWTKQRSGVLFEFVDWVMTSSDAYNLVQWTGSLANPIMIGLFIWAQVAFFSFNIVTVIFSVILFANCKKLYKMLKLAFGKKSWRVYNMTLGGTRDIFFGGK